MFSLIITIISIALVAALAVATIYYGGSAFTSGTAKANASAIVAAAQQVSGANTLYKNDTGGAGASDVGTLVTEKYLQSTPTLPSGIGSFTITATTVSTGATVKGAVCDAIISSVTGAKTVDGAARATEVTAGRAYDCYGTGDVNTFVFNG